MKTPSLVQSFAAAVAAVSLATGSVASAAPVARTVNPLVTLSLFGTAQSRAALCVAGSASAAAAASTTTAQAAPNCVLPVVDAAPAPVVAEAPPVAPYVAPAPYVAAGANLLPLLLSLGAFAAIFFLLDDVILGDGDDFEIDLPPPTPTSPS